MISSSRYTLVDYDPKESVITPNLQSQDFIRLSLSVHLLNKFKKPSPNTLYTSSLRGAVISQTIAKQILIKYQTAIQYFLKILPVNLVTLSFAKMFGPSRLVQKQMVALVTEGEGELAVD